MEAVVFLSGACATTVLNLADFITGVLVTLAYACILPSLEPICDLDQADMEALSVCSPHSEWMGLSVAILAISTVLSSAAWAMTVKLRRAGCCGSFFLGLLQLHHVDLGFCFNQGLCLEELSTQANRYTSIAPCSEPSSPWCSLWTWPAGPWVGQWTRGLGAALRTLPHDHWQPAFLLCPWARSLVWGFVHEPSDARVNLTGAGDTRARRPAFQG